MVKFIAKAIQWILMILLPFWMLIRLSVLVHEEYKTHAWLSLSIGVLATVILLAIYFSVVNFRLKGRLGNWRAFKSRTYFALSLVLIFTLYTSLFLSSENVKKQEIRSEFQQLHPILRVAVSTLILVDQDLIITDANRTPEDYGKMGLKTAKNSLHYVQSDGYSHAIDIRTNTRSKFRNKLLQYSFRSLGFNTLRHGGTADHLHISIMSHDRKNAI